MKDIQLTKEEKKLLIDFHNGKYIPVKDVEKRRDELQAVAENTIRKNKNINIRINESDLLSIKEKAIKKGIPYQTLVSSVLHQYATEQIKVNVT